MSIIDPAFGRALTSALASGPQALIATLNETIISLPGARTVTWLAVAPDHSVTHRIGTSDAGIFPIGGFDPIDDGAWGRRIFGDRQAIIANTPEQMLEFIPETDELVALGYGATLCAPIIIGDQVRGVLCVLGEAGVLTPALLDQISTILPIAALIFTFPGISER